MNIRVTAQPLPLRVPKGISLPASKSISNRMLLLRTLSGGEIKLHNISDCDDTIAMEQGLKSLGVQSPATIDVGAAGTAMRFLTAYFATTESQDVVITGTERMRHRPIGVLVDALRSMGADISYDGEDGYPPLHIKGRQLEGGTISLPGNVSSQYISALLMVAPTMQKGLTLSIIGEVISRPYINITTSLMRHFGISIEEPNERTIIVHSGKYQGGEYTIENDWSAASYWYEMLALAPEGEVRLQGLFADSLQGDSCVRQLFEPLGITTEFDENGAVLRKSSRVNSQWSMVNAEGIASGSSAVGGAGADFKEPRERSGNGQCRRHRERLVGCRRSRCRLQRAARAKRQWSMFNYKRPHHLSRPGADHGGHVLRYGRSVPLQRTAESAYQGDRPPAGPAAGAEQAGLPYYRAQRQHP